MFRRSKTDSASHEESTPRRLLVAGSDLQACSIYADVLATYGFDTTIATFDEVVDAMSTSLFGCAVIVGTDQDHRSALRIVHAIRRSEHVQVRRTGVVLLGGSDREQLVAWETGVDGFVVMPSHVDDIVATINAVLARLRTERHDHRLAMIERIAGSQSVPKFSQ